ncbi:MAG: hypothetical protein EOO01_06020 [Chitinophagaceae bacterium]|nr:MAG: hypothetical protein EOO01_06020 [Chitinophagaceae bacterium]
MKTLSLFIFLYMFTTIAYSQKIITNQPTVEQVNEKDKKIDVTIVIKGTTVRITGHVRFNLLTSTLIFDGSITVTGNGESIELPVNYSGPLKKGSNRHQYNEEAIPQEDRMITEWTLSRLYLMKGGKASFDGRKYLNTGSINDKP